MKNIFFKKINKILYLPQNILNWFSITLRKKCFFLSVYLPYSRINQSQHRWQWASPFLSDSAINVQLYLNFSPGKEEECMFVFLPFSFLHPPSGVIQVSVFLLVPEVAQSLSKLHSTPFDLIIPNIKQLFAKFN